MIPFTRWSALPERIVCWGLVLCLLLYAACSPAVRLGEEAEEHEDELIRLQRRLIDHPGDAEALREVGVIYLRTRRYTEAHDQLQNAYAHNQNDPKTLFYLGAASEMVGKRQAALRLYERYTEASRRSVYRRRLEGRYRWLMLKMAREEMQARLAREGARGDDVSTRHVAVFPLAYQGRDAQYAPLGRGLAEMMMADLAQVRRLSVVERVRLQALLDELELGQSAYVDPSTAPRMGRLLGAGRLVGGSYNVLSSGELRLDVALTSLETAMPFPELESRAGPLGRLFQLEKEAVFRVLDAFGVELTPDERRAIEVVPTQDLQAFLAYSRGLAQEEAGNYTGALEAYRRASSLDPTFEAAATRREAAAGLSLTGGAVQEVLEEVFSRESVSSASINLLDSRLRKLNESVGSIFAPGLDARQPAAEAFGASLPPPPDPPPTGERP